MDMRRLVGRNVLRVRKNRHITQEELAELSGFGQQYISGLEKGQRNPTVVTIYELSLALGVNYIELLKPPADRIGRLSCNRWQSKGSPVSTLPSASRI